MPEEIKSTGTPETLAGAAKAGVIGSARGFGRHAHRYAPAYLRGGLYALLMGILNFNETFEKLTPEQLAHMTALGWVCASLKPVGAVVAAIIAFLDQTLARINAKKEEEESRAPFSRLQG